MPEGSRRWSVTPRRLGAIVVLTALGVFLICGSVGKGDPTVGAIGLALAAVAAGIFVLPALSNRDLPWAQGTAHVVSASPPPSTTTYGRCTLQLLVSVRGQVGIPVRIREPKVPLAKWPELGEDLPVLVTVGGSRKVRVLWDEVPIHGTQQAQTQNVRTDEYDEYDLSGESAYIATSDGIDLDGIGGDAIDGDGIDAADIDATDMGIVDVDSAAVGFGDSGMLEIDQAAFESTVFDATVFDEPAVDESALDALVNATAVDALVVDVAVVDVAVVDPPVVESSQFGVVALEPIGVVDAPTVDAPTIDAPTVDAPTIDAPTVDIPTVDAPIAAGLGDRLADGSDDDPDDPDNGPKPVTYTPTVPVPRAGNAWPDLPDVDPEPDPDSHDDDDFLTGLTETNGTLSIELEVKINDPTTGRRQLAPPEPPSADTSSEAATGGVGDDAPQLPRRTPSPRPRMGVDQPVRNVIRGTATPIPPAASPSSGAPGPATGSPAAGSPPAASPPAASPPAGSPPVGSPPVQNPPAQNPPAQAPGSGADGSIDPRVVDRLLDNTAIEPPVLPAAVADVLLASVALTDSMPTVPIQFRQARVVSPGVAATPDPDEYVFDQASDTVSVSDAYIAATPPPGVTAGHGKIRSVAATLFVTDLSRSIIFYRDVLGFTESDAGRGSAVLVSGDAKIVLRRVGMAPVDRRLVQLLLEVPDVNAAYEDLRSRSVPFIHRPRKVGQYEQQTLWAAALRDPDGHGIAITQWRDARD